ncbi:MAG: GNAT family N-acetyltransferase [Caulobacteraceae bacterium]
MARAIGGEAEILTLAVAPRARRRGIGLGLVEAAALEAARRGGGALYLEVAADNDAATALYRATGFEQAGVRARLLRPRGRRRAMDALVLRRTLNSPAA